MIKDYDHAIEVLNACFQHFEIPSNLEINNSEILIFNWSNKKYQLHYLTGQVFEVRGHVFDVTDTSLLMQALIRKTVYPLNPSIKI